MPYTGQTIENPVSGERITFLQTARNTAGEKLAGAVVENQRVGLGQRSTV